METTAPATQKIEGVVDRYKGLEITDLSSLVNDEAGFDTQLIHALEDWRREGIRSVQIKFAPPKCHLMNVAHKHGFYFHHAKPKENYILMCLWMDSTTHDKIPAYADHYVGVGGAVINHKDEILLIQEHRQPEPRLWKFPGGFMDPGETIKQAVEREVLEETGVRTHFEGIIGLRETLDARYSATDLYLVCLLTVPDDAQAINIIDQREIFQAKWVPMGELLHNEADAKYRMFPNAWKFIGLLSQRLQQAKEKRLPLAMCCQESGDCSDLSATQLMKQTTLTLEEFTPSSGKGKPWVYYIAEPLKFDPSSSKL